MGDSGEGLGRESRPLSGKPVILQTAAMSPLFDSTPAAEFDVRTLWAAKDRDSILAEHGPSVVGMATTGSSAPRNASCAAATGSRAAIR